MNIFAQFQAIEEKDKAAAVRKLMQSSTPNFDFFYLVGLSVVMATLGLIIDSPSVVIGSMLIAPLLYPILGVGLGLSMSNYEVLHRSFLTLGRSLVLALVASTVTAFLLGNGEMTGEISARTVWSLEYVLIAVVAGAAVSFALAQPEWSETLPGIAISVALIPPLAVVGIGLAYMNVDMLTGSLVLFGANFIGILLAAMVTFSMMNLYEKQNIAESTIKREDEKVEKEAAAVAAVEQAHNAEVEVDITLK